MVMYWTLGGYPIDIYLCDGAALCECRSRRVGVGRPGARRGINRGGLQGRGPRRGGVRGLRERRRGGVICVL